MNMNIMFLLYFVVPLALGVIITLAGLILLFINSRKKPKMDLVDIEGWIAAGGKIVSARLEEGQAKDPYEPVIEYVYIVNDVEYRGNKIFPEGTANSNKADAQEILDNHPVNAYVPVHYDPLNPSQSSLEGHNQQMSSLAIAGWICTGFGVCACCFTSFMVLVIFGARNRSTSNCAGMESDVKIKRGFQLKRENFAATRAAQTESH